MQCRLKKSESHSKITANRRHIKAAAPFFLRQPSVARCPSAVRPHAVRSPPFVCRPGPRPLPPTAHTTKKEPRRRLPGVRIKGLEPPRRKASDPKSDVATNYTISACCLISATCPPCTASPRHLVRPASASPRHLVRPASASRPPLTGPGAESSVCGNHVTNQRKVNKNNTSTRSVRIKNWVFAFFLVTFVTN